MKLDEHGREDTKFLVLRANLQRFLSTLISLIILSEYNLTE